MINIKTLRKYYNLNQTIISKYLKCSQKGYSCYEIGRIEINIKNAIALAELYSVSMDIICDRIIISEEWIITNSVLKIDLLNQD